MIITDPKLWDEFVTANGSQFCQSWDWGELQLNLGRQIWRLGVMDQGQLVACGLMVKHHLPLGQNYLYSPRGPIVTDEKYFKPLCKEIRGILDQQRSIFLRFELVDQYQLPPTSYRLTIPVQPAETLILDLDRSEEEIFNSFHQKTRYNIRLAEKKNITVRESDTEADFEIFWQLISQTYSKQKIKTHPKNYYHQILKLSANSQQLTAKLFIAEFNGQPLAANLCYFYGTTATYTHGGSDYNYRQLMAPHLLQWHQIKYAKDAGYHYYDFWGIDAKRFPGVTRFKFGFGGQVVNYTGTYNLPIKKIWYILYQIAMKIFKKLWL